MDDLRLILFGIYIVSVLISWAKLDYIAERYDRDYFILYTYATLCPILNTVFAIAIVGDFIIAIGDFFGRLVEYLVNINKKKDKDDDRDR